MRAVPSQADIFERAAQCDRESRQAGDPERRKVLALLREMWISVANETPFMSPSELSEQIRVVERIHLLALGSASGGPEPAHPAHL